MEQYQGIKFNFKRRKLSFSYDTRLSRLNYWANLFSELGLAPLHPDGAYGNYSYRTSDESFMITKSGMVPSSTLTPENYCHVAGFDKSSTRFFIEGEAVPSSESFLHNEIYLTSPKTEAILHGHSPLLMVHSRELGIETTKRFYDYGTQELADSAVELVADGIDFFNLKDHGFVVLGKSIDSAGQLTLDYFSKLIALLKSK